MEPSHLSFFSTKILKETNFKNLGIKKTGKVRDVYVQEDKIILVATDRHTSFDRIIAYIPYKGEVLNRISAFWFENTQDIVRNHVLDVADPNILVAKKCHSIPVEVVVRGYITGVTDTSLWMQYQKGQRDFEDFILPEGLRKNQKLEKLVITPTTKSDTHDSPLTSRDIVEKNILPEAIWNEVKDKAIKLFMRGQKMAQAAGLILVDTKYEFGMDDEGKLTLIDEIHTPDSSRYWQADTYEERFCRGNEPEYFDKEFLRLWFKENCNPYKDPVLPNAPEKMVVELARRYIQIFERITGQSFVHNDDEDIIERMVKNLRPYAVI